MLAPLVSIGRWLCSGALLIRTASYKALLWCALPRKRVASTTDLPTPTDEVTTTDDCACAGSLTTIRSSIASDAVMYKRVWHQFCSDHPISTSWTGKIRHLVAYDWQVRLMLPSHAPPSRVPALGCSAGVRTVPQAKCRADRKRQKQYAKKKRQAAKRKNTVAPLQQRERPRVPMPFWVMALTSYTVLCTMNVVPLAALRDLLVQSIGVACSFVQWPSFFVRTVLSRTLAHEEDMIDGKSARRIKARKKGTQLQARHISRSRHRHGLKRKHPVASMTSHLFLSHMG